MPDGQSQLKAELPDSLCDNRSQRLLERAGRLGGRVKRTGVGTGHGAPQIYEGAAIINGSGSQLRHASSLLPWPATGEPPALAGTADRPLAPPFLRRAAIRVTAWQRSVLANYSRARCCIVP
jgi:hypothetical protein